MHPAAILTPMANYGYKSVRFLFNIIVRLEGPQLAIPGARGLGRIGLRFRVSTVGW